jgi:hypothetical protein
MFAAQAAEARASAAQADARAADHGADDGEPVGAPAGSADPSDLRQRLSRAAEAKKGRNPDTWSP